MIVSVSIILLRKRLFIKRVFFFQPPCVIFHIEVTVKLLRSCSSESLLFPAAFKRLYFQIINLFH